MKKPPLNLKHALNAEQYTAASIIEGPLLIIAGAGSGKTRMITYRIANMLDQGIPQSSILALTFTNKAAREMAVRIQELTGKKLPKLTASTFHAFGVKVLRKHCRVLGYHPNFTIYDQADMYAMIKNVAREMQISFDKLDLYYLANLFGEIKTRRSTWNRENSPWKPLFDEYCDHMKTFNAVDFNDLIILPIKLFEEHPDILESYQNTYTYIMVDEFQDTSHIQYHMMHLLARRHKNICVVGDDDQSIYSWRGANYENIANFEKDFPETREIKLEQNYRSTGNILSAANTVISHNTKRKFKELWTGEDAGSAISISYPEDETEESEFISSKIQELRGTHNFTYNQFGVLVRTNSLLQKLEEEFLSQNMPYTVSGGQSFFQRKEIKDIIAYLRLMANPNDDVNFLRIVNTPRRGIGKGTVQKVRGIAETKKCSLFSASEAAVLTEDSPIQDRFRASLEEFVELIKRHRDYILKKGKSGHLALAIRKLVEELEYKIHLTSEHPKNPKIGLWKYGNIEKFISMIDNWEHDPDTEDPGLFNYLNRITLTSKNEPESSGKKINLMTIHASKGLEFDIVFLPGVEERIIPHAKSIEENPDNIEEERRLFYVALTRARKALFITSCQRRKIMQDIVESVPSSFLDEIPKELLELAKEERIASVEDAEKSFAALRERLRQSS